MLHGITRIRKESRPMPQYELTGAEVVAIIDAATLALEDQANYLSSGDMILDYGNEWPEVRHRKAEVFFLLADAVDKLAGKGSMAAQSCRSLAKSFLETESREVTDAQ